MSRKPDLQDPPPRLPPEKAGHVLELERLLASSLFRSSRRCQSLLRRLVERTIRERCRLSERTPVGCGSLRSFHGLRHQPDPVVRASAAEIRKKLAQYYQEEGHAATRIQQVISNGYRPPSTTSMPLTHAIPAIGTKLMLIFP